MDKKVTELIDTFFLILTIGLSVVAGVVEVRQEVAVG
jgi:hypothetical protein